jgi:hypothetical protein
MRFAVVPSVLTRRFLRSASENKTATDVHQEKKVANLHMASKKLFSHSFSPDRFIIELVTRRFQV